MDMFEYVAVLTSIIIGLGIAHLLQGVARIVQHPDRDEVYWVHLTWVAYMFLTAVFWWWWEFGLAEIAVWSFQLYLFVLFFAVLVYLACALLFPADLEGYDGYRGYFYSRRGWFFGIGALSEVVDLMDTWLKGAEHFSSLGLEYWVVASLQIGLWVVATRTVHEQFHKIFAVSMLLYQMSWAVRLFGTMG